MPTEKTKIGIIGGGQLGLMLAESLGRMGAEIHVLDPSPTCPAQRACHQLWTAPFDDLVTLQKFVSHCQKVTYEFEAIDLPTLMQARERSGATIMPSPEILGITRSRFAERDFLTRHDLPCAPHAKASSLNELSQFIRQPGFPCVIKTDTGGYDGKGQWRVKNAQEWALVQPDLQRAVAAGMPLLAEAQINLKTELSVIVHRQKIDSVGRTDAGSQIYCSPFPVFENVHRDGILYQTRLPAQISDEVKNQAQQIAIRCTEILDLQGLLTVEFFLGTLPHEKGPQEPQLFVNEFAPRPHNSGHVTRRACHHSQFDALAATLLDIPLSGNAMLPLAAGLCYEMENILGCDISRLEAESPAGHTWQRQILQRDAILELYDYGKCESRPQRKMGHIIALKKLGEVPS